MADKLFDEDLLLQEALSSYFPTTSSSSSSSTTSSSSSSSSTPTPSSTPSKATPKATPKTTSTPSKAAPKATSSTPSKTPSSTPSKATPKATPKTTSTPSKAAPKATSPTPSSASSSTPSSTPPKSTPTPALNKSQSKLLKVLTGMGIPSFLCVPAVLNSTSIDEALKWIVDNTSMSFVPKKEYKMVFLVRQDLIMSTGKIAAQCAHAAISLYKQLQKNDSKEAKDFIDGWDEEDSQKVALKVSGESQMLQLMDEAKKIGLFTKFLGDDVRVIPSLPIGTITVVAIAGESESVDKVTGNLHLL